MPPASLPLSRRPGSIVAALFFASHIPVTLFVDSQAVLPREWYPSWCRLAFDWYLDTYKDPLMTTLPVWFRSLVWTEVLIQLPFFFYALGCFLRGDQKIRKPAAAYGFSVATTLVPILAELYLGERALETLDQQQRLTLVAFYVPYFAIPLWLGTWMLRDNAPFAAASSSSSSKKGKRRR